MVSRERALVARIVALILALSAATAAAGAPVLPGYEVRYGVRIGRDCIADVTIAVAENPKRLRELHIRVDPERHFDFAGDGAIDESSDKRIWSLPPDHGELRY